MTSPRMAARRDYPDFVLGAHATTHEEGGASFRTILHLVLRDESPDLPAEFTPRPVGVFIGANPSRALGDGSDATVNKVLRWMRAQGVGEVYIFNLSPYRATDAADAVRWLSEPGRVALSNAINADAYDRVADLLKAARPPVILAGWGNCLEPHVEDLVRPWRPLLAPRLTIADLVSGIEAPEIHHLPLTNAGNPTHPLYADLSRVTSRRGLP